MSEERTHRTVAWSDDGETLPPAAVDGLNSLYVASARPTSDLDAAVMAEAHHRLGRRGAVITRIRRVAAAAAVILLATGVFIAAVWLRPARQAPRATVAANAADVDGNGIVDVRDAFHIARIVDRGGVPDPSWDATADGTVNKSDAEHVLRLAVSLGDSPSSREEG